MLRLRPRPRPPLLPLLAAVVLAALAAAAPLAGDAYAQPSPPAGTGAADVRFSSPGSVATHWDGTVYVADTGNHRIQVFHPNGTLDFSFGSFGSGDGNFSSPGGVDVTNRMAKNQSKIVVADTGNHRIQVFHHNGTHAFSFGSFGSGDGNFSSPGGVAVTRFSPFRPDTACPIAVADTGNHRIQFFQSDGTHAFSLGSFGSGDGNFSSPGGVAMDRDCRIYVADTGNHRVQLFEWSGYAPSDYDISRMFDRVVGSRGSGDGQFESPRSINEGWNYRVAVADTGNHRVQVFVGHTFLFKVGMFGSGDGNFSSPGGAGTGLVNATLGTYVADTGNHRVQVFLHYNGTHAFSFGSEGGPGGQQRQPTPPPAVDPPPAGGNGTGPPTPPPPMPPGPAPGSPSETCGAALSPVELAFGRVELGGRSAVVQQEVRAAGTLPLSIVSVEADGAWLGAAGVGVAPASVTHVRAAGAGWIPLGGGPVAMPASAGSAVVEFRIDLPRDLLRPGVTEERMSQAVTYHVSCFGPPTAQGMPSDRLVNTTTGVITAVAVQPSSPVVAPPVVAPPPPGGQFGGGNCTCPPPAPANGTAPPAPAVVAPPVVAPPIGQDDPPPPVAVVPSPGGPLNCTCPPPPVTVVIEPAAVAAGPLNFTGAGPAANLTIDVAGLAGAGGPPLDGSTSSTVTFPPSETTVVASFATVTFPPNVVAAHVPAGGRLALHVAVDMPDDVRVQGALAYEGSGRVALQRVVEVGGASGRVEFDMPVRILLEGQAGGRAFYIEGGAAGGTITPIDAACAADDTARVHRHLGGSGECQMDSADGGDKIIYTYHLTRFGTVLPVGAAPPPVVHTCSVGLGMPSLNVEVQPGKPSPPVRQTMINSGSAPFARVDLSATMWRAGPSQGADAPASLPSSATEVGTEGAGGPYMPLANGTAVAHDLGGGLDEGLWFRLNLAPYDDLRAGTTLVQNITYYAECVPS